MSTRQLVIVDIETTSLNTKTCAILEVAAVNTATGASVRFVPFVHDDDLVHVDPVAMQINGYHDRGLYEEMLSPADTEEWWDILRGMLTGNTFGGSNPRFDSDLVAREIDPTVWHHRLADIANYTAGALKLSPTELPGLDRCCELLGVHNDGPHSALHDAIATARCFAAIERLHGEDSEWIR
ncbi:exonuclease domain-containing protein [Rhodococcus sp. MALMAid1271]|uniref:3'-5' exonuclease n=1 Tax=Rhodococcus sp. MALMAid1271 TaxID=3411744 RepID=UPI003B9F2FB3